MRALLLSTKLVPLLNNKLKLPLYSSGMGWLSVAFISMLLCSFIKK